MPHPLNRSADHTYLLPLAAGMTFEMLLCRNPVVMPLLVIVPSIRKMASTIVCAGYMVRGVWREGCVEGGGRGY